MKTPHYTAIPTADYQHFLRYQQRKAIILAVLTVLKHLVMLLLMFSPFGLFWFAEWYFGGVV